MKVGGSSLKRAEHGAEGVAEITVKLGAAAARKEESMAGITGGAERKEQILAVSNGKVSGAVG